MPTFLRLTATRCEKTGKRRHNSYEEAKVHLKHLARQDRTYKTGRHKGHVYLCDLCYGYHVGRKSWWYK